MYSQKINNNSKTMTVFLHTQSTTHSNNCAQNILDLLANYYVISISSDLKAPSFQMWKFSWIA
jgi:hypothetical protein